MNVVAWAFTRMSQGGARLHWLQAEANRISTSLRESVAEPLAHKLSAVVTRLSETSQQTGDRLVGLSRSVATVASDVVKYAVAGTDGLRAATNGRLSEELGRGVDKLALSAEEVGKGVIGGVSSVSKSAAASVPAVQDRISLFSSQVGREISFPCMLTVLVPSLHFWRLCQRVLGVARPYLQRAS